MDVGLSTVAQMARDDTRWFVVGVVVLALILMLALPITVLLVIDDLKIRNEVRYELRKLKKLEQRIEDEKNAASKLAPVDRMP